MSETTFRSHTSEQGVRYAQTRSSYHPDLYQLIINHHISTGGQLTTLLDVGCGPGTVARALAPRFTHTIGIDPSEGMISTAQSLGGVTSGGDPIHFVVSTAEALGSDVSSLAAPVVDEGTVDLITVAKAAHWFDMAHFWARAAQVLKPGGTVAIWGGSSLLYIHPSVPNQAAIQAAMTRLVDVQLKPYMGVGNLLGQELYINLPLPWALEEPVLEFDESTFFRKEWGTAASTEDNIQLMSERTVNLDTLEKVLGTTSPIIRWREANPAAVGTDQDIVRMLRREIEQLLHEAGVEKGKETVKGAVIGVLLMVKKKKQEQSE